jgi:hypothetical protein
VGPIAGLDDDPTGTQTLIPRSSSSRPVAIPTALSRHLPIAVAVLHEEWA